jgi:hypothetical protein
MNWRNIMIEWRPAEFSDITEMVQLSQRCYQAEVDNLLTPDPARLTARLAHAIIDRNYNPGTEVVQISRDPQGQLIAWSWMGRGVGVDYAAEECAEAHVIHIDLNLSSRTRIKLINSLLDLWIEWCQILAIPILVSTTIRQDWQAFMRLHERRGFDVRGSHAFKRIERNSNASN